MLTNLLLSSSPNDLKDKTMVAETSSQSWFHLLAQFGHRNRLELPGTVAYSLVLCPMPSINVNIVMSFYGRNVGTPKDK